jgi:regulatory protein
MGGAMARSAYDYSLDLLGARPYTVRNLSRKLAEKGFPPDEREAAVARLTASGLLDDRKFAFEFARQKIVGGGAATRRVRQSLMMKGIPSQVVDEAIAALLADEPVDHDAAIEKLAARKLRSLTGLDEAVQRRRLFGYLSRRGYEIDDVKRVIRRILS